MVPDLNLPLVHTACNLLQNQLWLSLLSSVAHRMHTFSVTSLHAQLLALSFKHCVRLVYVNAATLLALAFAARWQAGCACFDRLQLSHYRDFLKRFLPCSCAQALLLDYCRQTRRDEGVAQRQHAALGCSQVRHSPAIAGCTKRRASQG